MSQAFTLNAAANYRVGAVYPQVSLSLISPTIQVQAGTESSGSFQVKYLDILQKYSLPHISSDQLVQAWDSNPMQFWQNQVNFAVWSATTGCGVSAQDHLAADDPLIRALYRFHVYYQIRRILDEIQAPLPQDQAWSSLNNGYDRRAYERICSEFGVSPHTNWRLGGINNGLGEVYNYWTNNGYHVFGKGDYNPATMSFTKQTSNEVLHVDYIAQDSTTETAWSTLVLDKSAGFTRPGVERLNDSIRTYVWAILGAQAQTRTGILGSGTAFDAQKQFLANLDDAIASPVDLPAAITRYQDVLEYAASAVNFVFGHDLYMAPSDMLLRVGRVAGYNNLIVVATGNQALGLNSGLNISNVPPNASGYTGEAGHIKPQDRYVGPSTAPPPPSPVVQQPASGLKKHADEKTALIVGAVGICLLALWSLGRV